MRKLSVFILLMSIPFASAWAQNSAGAISMPRSSSSVVVPAATYAGIAVTSVTAGAPVSGLPCFSCIANITGTDVGLSMPLTVLTQGSAVTITVLFEDTTYTGACSVNYYLKQGKTVIQKGTYNYPAGCSPNTFNGTYFNVTVPSLPGSTTLQATVVAGSIKTAVSQSLTIQ